MRNITAELDEIYLPQKAIVINVCNGDNSKVYVESYDFDKNGRPVNVHPLSVLEMKQLAASLETSDELNHDFLDCRSILPANLLFKDHLASGITIWYTKERMVNLLFKPELGIPSGQGRVPALIWKADSDNLWIYALNKNSRPKLKIQLYKAPFFNIHSDGKVCLGTVDITIEDANNMTEFMRRWENYFWNSYFSHLLEDKSPVKGNIVELWKRQISSGQKFPVDVLTPIKLTLNDILR